MSHPVDYSTFAPRLLAGLGVAHEGLVAPSVLLFDEMGFDSLLAFQLIVVIEEMAELIAPVADLPMIWTMGDAYDYYVVACLEAESMWT